MDSSMAEVAQGVTPELWAWASAGALTMPERAFPPPVGLWEGVDSYLGVPIANVLGYRTLRLDLHLPKHTSAGSSGKAPAIVYASGGAWRLSLTHHGPWRFLLDHGYAVAVVEYRPSGEALFPAALHDIKAAVRWLRAAAEPLGLDPARFGGWGSSAGALLMGLAGLTSGAPFEGEIGESLATSSELSCVISHYAPTDFLTLVEDTNHLPGVAQQASTDRSSATLFLGATVDDEPELARSASPVAHVFREAPPFLIVHGTADTRVGYRQAVRFHDALEAVGAEVELRPIEGADHIDAAFDGPESRAWTLAFVQHWLSQ